jgi:hypothetical protein
MLPGLRRSDLYVVCVGTGEVRSDRLLIDVAELIWEPAAELGF